MLLRDSTYSCIKYTYLMSFSIPHLCGEMYSHILFQSGGTNILKLKSLNALILRITSRIRKIFFSFDSPIMEEDDILFIITVRP